MVLALSGVPKVGCSYIWHWEHSYSRRTQDSAHTNLVCGRRALTRAEECQAGRVWGKPSIHITGPYR